MSLFDYRVSMDLASKDLPFYALIMAAMRQADTANAHALAVTFPKVWEELQARYNANLGMLEGD